MNKEGDGFRALIRRWKAFRLSSRSPRRKYCSPAAASSSNLIGSEVTDSCKRDKTTAASFQWPSGTETVPRTGNGFKASTALALGRGCRHSRLTSRRRVMGLLNDNEFPIFRGRWALDDVQVYPACYFFARGILCIPRKLTLGLGGVRSIDHFGAENLAPGGGVNADLGTGTDVRKTERDTRRRFPRHGVSKRPADVQIDHIADGEPACACSDVGGFHGDAPAQAAGCVEHAGAVDVTARRAPGERPYRHRRTELVSSTGREIF